MRGWGWVRVSVGSDTEGAESDVEGEAEGEEADNQYEASTLIRFVTLT